MGTTEVDQLVQEELSRVDGQKPINIQISNQDVNQEIEHNLQQSPTMVKIMQKLDQSEMNHILSKVADELHQRVINEISQISKSASGSPPRRRQVSLSKIKKNSIASSVSPSKRSKKTQDILSDEMNMSRYSRNQSRKRDSTPLRGSTTNIDSELDPKQQQLLDEKRER